MSRYYVRIKPGLTGINIVHKEWCPFMPEIGNRIPLGCHSECRKANEKARIFFLRVTGCYYCNRAGYDSINIPKKN